MADDKVFIPPSSGGIVTYYKDYKSKIAFDPNYVIIAIIIVLILEFILHKSSFLIN